jgi:hypothetical protein
VSLIDDFCDSYSTIEESEKFTMAIERFASIHDHLLLPEIAADAMPKK